MSSQAPSIPSTSTSSSSLQVATLNPNPPNTTGQGQLVAEDPALNNFIETYSSLKKALTEKQEEVWNFSDNLTRCIEVNTDLRTENEKLKGEVNQLQYQLAAVQEHGDEELVNLTMVNTLLQEDCQESDGALEMIRRDKAYFEREVSQLRAQVRALEARAEAPGSAGALVLRNPGEARPPVSSRIANGGNRREVELKEASSQTEENSLAVLGAASGPSSHQDQETQCQTDDFMETDAGDTELFKSGNTQQSQQGSENVTNSNGGSQPQAPLSNGNPISTFSAPASVPTNSQSQGLSNGGLGHGQSQNRCPGSVPEFQVKQETILFPCALCGSKFVHFNLLSRHLRRRHCQPHIRCPFCIKIFQYQSTLERHIIQRHEKGSSQSQSVGVGSQSQSTNGASKQ